MAVIAVDSGAATLLKEVKGGVRDPDLVRAQYEDYWSFVLESARTIAAAEPDSLARAVHLCGAAFASRPVKTRRLRGRRIANVLAGCTLPPRLSRRGIDAMTRAVTADLLLQYCGTDTQQVIELGSGWGANLFHLWLAGGPRDAAYAALEYTAAGREVTQLLGGIEPKLHIDSSPFDYHKPDLSAFRSAARTLIFTSHSIEQITHIGDALFDELLAVPGLDRVVHVEPVGWQLAAGTPLGGLMPLLTRLTPPRLSLEIEVRRRTRKHAYNTDLVAQLRRLEGAGRIRIERIEKNYVGPNPFNPGTVIVWRRA